MEHRADQLWECVIVGGGAAGLSAALVLGRARRRVLLLDAGEQSNRIAHGVGGLLGHDQRPPQELYAAGRAELAAYPSVEVRSGAVAGGERAAVGFELTLVDGSTTTAGRVLLATGMNYRYPAVAGIEPLWGNSVFHCPFCHGWEVRERPLGVLDDGASGVHRAVLLRSWSDDVTLLTSGPSALDEGERAQLARAGITIDERVVAKLIASGSALTEVRFDDESRRPLGGLLVPVALHQRTQLAAQLGAALAPAGPLSEDTIQIDAMGETTVPGLFAAGDISALMPSVPAAMAAGNLAGAMIVGSLMQELALG